MNQASGSIWNTNSWQCVYFRHWESKNFTPLVKKLLQERIQKLELRIGDDDFIIDQVDLTGEVL